MLAGLLLSWVRPHGALIVVGSLDDGCGSRRLAEHLAIATSSAPGAVDAVEVDADPPLLIARRGAQRRVASTLDGLVGPVGAVLLRTFGRGS